MCTALLQGKIISDNLGETVTSLQIPWSLVQTPTRLELPTIETHDQSHQGTTQALGTGPTLDARLGCE